MSAATSALRAAGPTRMFGPGGRGRLLGLAQFGVGAVLTVQPARVAATAAGPGGRPAPGGLVRVLGMRSLLQGLLTATTPTRTVLLGGALVDASHAASMVPVIIASPNYRRAAAVSALAATTSAALGALAAARKGARGSERVT